MSKNTSKNLYYEDEVIEEKFNVFMLKRMISYASSYKSTYIKVIVLLVVSSLLSLIPAAINKLIIDDVLPKNGIVPDNFVSLSTILLSIWITLSIGFAIFQYFCNKVSNMLGNTIINNLRNDLFDKLMTLSFDYYDSRPTGKILVRITNYTDEIADFFINDMTRIINNVFMMGFSLICVLIVDIRLALVVLIISIPLGLIVWLLSRALQKRVELDRNKYSNRTAFLAEDITGLEVIKAFNREDLNEDIFKELNDKYFNAFMRSTHVREALFPMTHGSVRIISSVVIYSVALLIILNNNSALSLGSLVIASTYMSIFSSSMCTICQRLQYIANTTSNIERIFDVLDTQAMVVDKKDAKIMPSVKGNVTFENVTFGYNEHTNVLTNVNLNVKAGEMIALVGPTGAGKTTFISLLDRFYNIKSGTIKIDDIDIYDVTLESLRNQIGVMMQDTYLFTGTIMENIRFAKPSASDEECIEAAKKVFADKFITKMKDGYQTEISSMGTELSGGEKQLLSFARLILKNPNIVILDEATSNIDTDTESMIQEMLKIVLKGRTSFVIAHRLSTIKNADRILYIDEENILEDGSHDDLIAKKGRYYELIKRSKA